MIHPAEGRLPHDPAGPRPPSEPASGGAWIEARIPAVFAAVLATWVLIAALKVLRHLMW